MDAEPISTLYSQSLTDGWNFKEPSWGIKICEEDKNDKQVDYLLSLI